MKKSKNYSWKMEKQCTDCPFSKSGPGLALRKSLAPGRFQSIKEDLMSGSHFLCHKTTRETGDGSNRVCAGALEFQEKKGVESNYVRICRRIDAIRMK